MGLSGSITEVDTFTASVPTPGAGTPVLAADVIAGEQALANRTKHLGMRWGIVGSPTILANHDDALATAFAAWAGTLSYADAGSGPAPIQINVPNVLVGDVIKFDLTAIMLYACGAGGGDIALFQVDVIDDVAGAAVATVLNGHAAIESPVSLTRNYQISITGLHTATNAGTTRFKVQTRSINFTGNVIDAKSYTAIGTLMRPGNL